MCLLPFSICRRLSVVVFLHLLSSLFPCLASPQCNAKIACFDAFWPSMQVFQGERDGNCVQVVAHANDSQKILLVGDDVPPASFASLL